MRRSSRLHPGVARSPPLAFRRLRWPPARWPALVRAIAAPSRASSAPGATTSFVDLQGLMKSALPARLAGLRSSATTRQARREPAAAGSIAGVAVSADMHAVERIRRLLAAAVGYAVPRGHGQATDCPRPVGRPAMRLAGALRPDRACGELADEALAGRTLAAPPPPPRRDRPHRGAAVGHVDERQRAERLAAGITGAAPLSSKLDSEDLTELVAGADFAVGIDTGLMHLAAAFDIPGVTLFGPTDADYAMPYGAHQRAVRSDHLDAPCQQVRCTRQPHGQCCMREVDVDEVWAAVSTMLSEQAAG